MKALLVVLSICLAAALTAATQDDAAPMPVDPLAKGGPLITPPTAVQDSDDPHPEDGKVQEILAHYARVTGKKVIYDNTVQGTISGVADRSISKEKAAELIERALFLNGFTLVDVSEDTVAVLGLGRPVRNVGIPLYSKLEEIPKAERVFSYLFKLQHRDTREIQSLLQQYIPPNNSTGFVADEPSRTLVATGQTSLIRTVIQLVAVLDVPGSADKDAPSAPPNKRHGEKLPAQPRPLKPPQPVPNEGDDQ